MLPCFSNHSGGKISLKTQHLKDHNPGNKTKTIIINTMEIYKQFRKLQLLSLNSAKPETKT
jgi:hypothetical protein